jgi:YVTN family beta-propeller protein
VIKLSANPATGAAQVLSDPSDPTRVLQIPTQSNPRGIVVSPDDSRAFVMNYVSRSLTVINLATVPEQVIANVPTAALPAPGTLEDTVQIGKELYNTSIGVFDSVPPGGAPIVGRMANNGWGACATCHPNGLSDNVVWIFPDGPRRTISQHTDFAKSGPAVGLEFSGVSDIAEGRAQSADGGVADRPFAAASAARHRHPDLRGRPEQRAVGVRLRGRAVGELP